jgi:hypothetical protein
MLAKEIHYTCRPQKSITHSGHRHPLHILATDIHYTFWPQTSITHAGHRHPLHILATVLYYYFLTTKHKIDALKLSIDLPELA